MPNHVNLTMIHAAAGRSARLLANRNGCHGPCGLPSASWLLLFGIIAVVPIGCHSANRARVSVDSTIGRAASSADEAFAEGQLDTALKQYRRALHRAWAIDDPVASGTIAYNLAASWLSADQTDLARDWLLEARSELCRGGNSTANVWLMESKIALQQCRFDDARLYIGRAEGTEPPCGDGSRQCGCCRTDPCSESCLKGVPVLGPHLSEKRGKRQCKRDFQTQVSLAKARLAAEQYDIPQAMQHFRNACENAKHVCSEDLQAELHNVAALIHLANGQHFQAACHFDAEAKHLRLAGNHREIPGILELAAAAYQHSGRQRIAANRLCRVARIWLGRGHPRKAWEMLQAANEMASRIYCENTQIRLSLTASEISQVLTASDANLPDRREDLMVE